MRQLSKESVLYTEMITASAIIHSDDETRRRLLTSDFLLEEPLVLQLGGADPELMKRAVGIATQYGYKQFNINCGCPSDKVSGSGCFGAALMLQPELVGRLANAVFETSGSFATIKCRIGVNDVESYESLASFVETVHKLAGVQHFVIHARKAVLNKNFSPHDNRSIPPLKYGFVYDLVRDFPHISFSLNGGVKTYEDVLSHLKHGVVGVMVGRGAVEDPFYWSKIDQQIYNKESVETGMLPPTRRSVLAAYVEYADKIEKVEGRKVRRTLLKPILNLFSGQKNGRRFRNLMDTYIKDENRLVGSGVIYAATACLSPEVLDGYSEQQQQLADT
jgi:tRNA-dihydrouridine synthase A